jgi:serine/threonine-protein kinase RsbW
MNSRALAPPDSPPAAQKPVAAARELARLRSKCRSHERALDGLARACADLRRGTAALKAENAELRAQLYQIGNDGTSSARARHGEPLTIALPADPRAPGAARIAMRRWLTPRVPSNVVEDAQLVVSELLTNSVRHAGVTPRDVLHVRAQLARGVLHLEVEDPGSDRAIAPAAPDLQHGTGFGLNLVASLATRWGVSRNGHTGVWADLTWIASSATLNPSSHTNQS